MVNCRLRLFGQYDRAAAVACEKDTGFTCCADRVVIDENRPAAIHRQAGSTR
jgi:hypothetical protein